MILIFLILTALFCKKIISLNNLPLILIGFSVLNLIIQYIVNTLSLPKDIENFVSLEIETR